MAIKACTPEKSSLLKNREEMRMVKESLDEGYCDVTGRTGDLDLMGMCSTSSYDFLIPLQRRIHRQHGWYKGFCGAR